MKLRVAATTSALLTTARATSGATKLSGSSPFGQNRSGSNKPNVAIANCKGCNRTQEVGGSSPPSSTSRKPCYRGAFVS